MSDNGFKDYIEKRTVEQIMADYSEQHDEWRSYPVSRDADKNPSEKDISADGTKNNG